MTGIMGANTPKIKGDRRLQPLLLQAQWSNPGFTARLRTDQSTAARALIGCCYDQCVISDWNTHVLHHREQ